MTCWKTFLHPEGDHFTLINVYKAYQDAALSSAGERKWCLTLRSPQNPPSFPQEAQSLVEHPLSRPGHCGGTGLRPSMQP